MTIYKFIEHAEVMRKNGSPFRRSPSRRAVYEAAWGKLWGFRIKHPDSTRTPKARRRSRELRAARIEVSL
jgi:hypothetical protein